MPLLGLLIAAMNLPSPALADSPSKGSAWSYSLIQGSELLDDCPACGRPSFNVPLRGSFSLQLLEENPLFATYSLSNINFTGGSGGLGYRITGEGTYRIGGEVALVQEMFLKVRITKGDETTDALLESKLVVVERRWPVLSLELQQTNGTLLQFYAITLVAAPLREIWFSTANRFNSGTLPRLEAAVSDGDLLSNTGRPVRRQRDLVGRLGIMPVVPDLGLDAVDVGSGGLIAFSTERTVFSETLGVLQHGDILSERGQLLLKNQTLLAAFGIQPPVSDLGLDALHNLKNEPTPAVEFWFSIEQEAFSERLGQMLRPGDVLSNRGQIIRSNRELLSRFKPAAPETDYGLDALYVWPSGEIWFSTEKGFESSDRLLYTDGDLLSDQGYVVFRNLELVSAYAPLEDVANFGLDSLWIVTDATPPPARGPRLTSIQPNLQTGAVTLRWEGLGSAFQLEGATDLTGPYLPISPIFPQLEFEHLEAFKNSSIQFYRVRQW